MFYLRLLNIPRAEWGLTTPGEIFDLAACWQILHGAKEKDDGGEFWDMLEDDG